MSVGKQSIPVPLAGARGTAAAADASVLDGANGGDSSNSDSNINNKDSDSVTGGSEGTIAAKMLGEGELDSLVRLHMTDETTVEGRLFTFNPENNMVVIEIPKVRVFRSRFFCEIESSQRERGRGVARPFPPPFLSPLPPIFLPPSLLPLPPPLLLPHPVVANVFISS